MRRLDNTCYTVLSILQVCCWGSDGPGSLHPLNCTAVLKLVHTVLHLVLLGC